MNRSTKAIICSILLSSCCLMAEDKNPMDVNIDSDAIYYFKKSEQRITPLEIKDAVIDKNAENQDKAIAPEDNSEKNDTENDEQENIAPIEGKVQVNTTLRLREYPWGPILGSYTNNTKVSIIGEEGDFYKVNINGKIGYAHKNYISTPDKPASRIEPEYPGNCKNGGYIARSTTSSDNSSSSTVNKNSNSNSKTVSSSFATSYKQDALVCKSDNTRVVNPALSVAATSNTLPVKTSVIGAKQGDGTAAGAITWAKDQMQGGSQKGYNKNNGKVSSSATCWNSWCAAFCATAWGRQIPQMVASCAYGQYKNFKKAGMIHNTMNPPAGAICFTGPTATSQYGHVFLATGEVNANGEPIIITSGWSGHNWITTMTLSQMIGSKNYLGWALPE